MVTGATATALRHVWGAAILRTLRLWRERERQRWELSTMSQRDFGDLSVPAGLADEARRWPWPADRPIEPPSWLGLALLLALAAASSGVALTYPEAIAAAFG
jgi:uncharacterized protein YjiS (DUF1127 family)